MKTLQPLPDRGLPATRPSHSVAVDSPSEATETLPLAQQLERARVTLLGITLLTPAALAEVRALRAELAAQQLRPEAILEDKREEPEEVAVHLASWNRWLTRLHKQRAAAPAGTELATLSQLLAEIEQRLSRIFPAVTLNDLAEERLLAAARAQLFDAEDLNARDSGVLEREPESAAAPLLAAYIEPMQRYFMCAEQEVNRLTGQIVVANQGLVNFVVKRYASMGLSLSDLMQEGNIGLMRAVKKFDPHRGIRFNTYAVWWIRQSAQRALADQSRTIRIPVHVLEDRRALLRTSQRLDSEGRPSSVNELGEHTGFSKQKVSRLLDLAKEPLSLDAPKGPDDDARLLDFISDSKAVDPTHRMIEAERGRQLSELLTTLTPREHHMLRMRFGIGGADECTLEQVGQAFGVTRERARQIVDGAVDKMRRAACRKRMS